MDQQEPEEPSLVGEEQAHESELWSEEDCVLWSRGNRSNTGFGFSKGNEGLRKGGFRTDPSEQGPSSVFYQHKCKGKDQQGRGKGGAYPQTGFSASEISVEEGQGHPWESDDWAIPLVQLAEALLRGIIQDVRLG